MAGTSKFTSLRVVRHKTYPHGTSVNHNSTGVTSGVTLIKKIELEIEHNVDKMECSTKN